MASYRGHLMLATPLGVVYGSLSLLRPELDWGPALLGAALTTLGGLLPDLDSDSGVPVRELFGVTAALVPAFLYHPLVSLGLPLEQTLALLVLAYLFVKFPLAHCFKHWTVHRGMFHSVPAMLIVGLLIYLFYPGPDGLMRLYLAGGAMLGFLSHLVLDEIYSIDFNGLRFRQNRFAGSALKFASPSLPATLTAYAILGGLGYLAWNGGLPNLPWPTTLPHLSWTAGEPSRPLPAPQHVPEIPSRR